MLLSFWGRIYAVKIGQVTEGRKSSNQLQLKPSLISACILHHIHPRYPTKMQKYHRPSNSNKLGPQSHAAATTIERERNDEYFLKLIQVTSPRCMIHMFKLGTSTPRPPAATQIPSHLGRFPKGSLYDPIHLFNTTHGQVVCQGQKLAGEGVWQGTHHGAHDLS